MVLLIRRKKANKTLNIMKVRNVMLVHSHQGQTLSVVRGPDFDVYGADFFILSLLLLTVSATSAGMSEISKS